MISEQECMIYNEKIKNIIKCYLLIYLYVVFCFSFGYKMFIDIYILGYY